MGVLQVARQNGCKSSSARSLRRHLVRARPRREACAWRFPELFSPAKRKGVDLVVGTSFFRRAAVMDTVRPRRVPLKSHRPNWREELRTNCLRRVKMDRVHLLWKIRTQGSLPADDMKTAESAVRNIISDEVQKLKHSVDGKEHQDIDMIWDYQGPLAAEPAEFDSEDILLEMERLLYEDLREEMIRKEIEALEEEDAYLAQAVFDHMQLNDGEAAKNEKLWCPVCKQGELRETHNLIHCTLCKLRLDLGEDKINLDFLRERLANVHMEHLDRGCKSSLKFFLQNMFEMTALYMQCEKCNTFDVVI